MRLNALWSIEATVIVELKSVEKVLPVHQARSTGSPSRKSRRTSRSYPSEAARRAQYGTSLVVAAPPPGKTGDCPSFSTLARTEAFQAAGTSSPLGSESDPGATLQRPRAERKAQHFACEARLRRASPGEVREELVRLRHLVDVVAPGDGGSLAVEGVGQLVGEPLGHGLALPGAGLEDDLADGQGLLALPVHFHGDLVRCAADALRAHLNLGLDVVDRLEEHLQRLNV